MEDTVVRGARINLKNAKNTKTVQVNPGDDPIVKTGETGVSSEYVIQTSLIGNDLKGYGTFTNNSDIVREYSGPQNVVHGDIIRLDTDVTFYNVTGMQGTDVYLAEKFVKKNATDPSVQSGVATVRKVKLDSVKYESVKSDGSQNIIAYDKDKTDWGITGINFSDPKIAPSNQVSFETGMTLQFMPGASTRKEDLTTVGSVYKTLVDNNTSAISDLSLSPLPYPHESLKVYAGTASSTPALLVENENYVVNYSQSPEYKFPRPPYEERPVAYLKFLDKISEEVQVSKIDGTFEGSLSIQKKTVVSGGADLVHLIKDIIPTSSFVLKVADSDKKTYTDYIPDYAAGLATFVKHKNSENLIGAISYVQRLMWDGISVIKGVTEDLVQDTSNLVIPGVSGLPGVTGMVYYEDTDQNNLIRDIDYLLDPESGSIGFTSPLKDSESVLVSYYVEGEDVSNERVLLTDMRANRYPIIASTVTLTMQYKTFEENKEVTKTKVLVEGEDYTLSYITGRIFLNSLASDEEVLSLEISYTPMAAVNCIMQTIPGDSLNYRIRIIDDVVKIVDPTKLVFQINNPLISIPQKKTFQDEVTTSNYDFLSPVLSDSLVSVINENGPVSYDVSGYTYTDVSRQIKLDESLSDKFPDIDDTVAATYSFEAERLPYAPALLINVIFNQGESSFVIEGFDRTDVLKSGMVLRIDNFDPENIFYFKIKSVTYTHSNTVVTLYGSFSETIINPTFYLLDDAIAWQSLPSEASVDTTAAIGSDAFIIEGSPLQIKQNIKKDSLLMVNGAQIYTVTAVTTTGTQSIIGVYPPLQSELSETVQYSLLPMHANGDDTLDAQQFALTDPSEPAFTISYKSPDGFEGSAKLLVDKTNIVIFEAIRGMVNPEPYIFKISDYDSVYELAKTIQRTKSTFHTNVPLLDVPDYSPFTLAPDGSTEDYYLAQGNYSPERIVPFEQDILVDLPYTFQITPDLFKWTLLQAYANQPSFTVKNIDRTGTFLSGNLLAFQNKFDGAVYFYEVAKSELVDDISDSTIKNTLISLQEEFRTNLLDPTVYKYDNVLWHPLQNDIADIDYENSEITFGGSIQGNFREGTVLKFADKYVYQVTAVEETVSNFKVTLTPSITSNVRMESYFGYAKQSSVPIYLNEVGPQPFLSILYTAPIAHTGTASIKVDADGVYLKETIDNFHEKQTVLLFSMFNNFIELITAINQIESYSGTSTPFAAAVPDSYLSILSNDKFDIYKLRNTGEQYVTLPNVLLIVAAAFEISYTAPAGYIGSATVSVLPEEIVLTESIENYLTEPVAVNIVRIRYDSTQSLAQLASTVISEVPSLVAGGGYPYSTILNNTQLFRAGLWDVTHIASLSSEAQSAPTNIYGIVDGAYWYGLGILNERRMAQGTDYEIETGSIALTKPIVPLDRFRFNYMGLWDLAEYEGSSIKCSCQYFTDLAVGSRVDIYMDFLNIDQFYLQKLTEKKFTEIVVAPQIQELLDQKGSGGGQGSDNGANNNSTPAYQGGSVDLYYALRDEEIKKQLYIRFYHWYKARLRDLSAELQLGMGFKFGHSNALGLDSNNQYTLDDKYVESEDYTLTTDTDIKQINNGFSKFFPVGYDSQAPMYYPRFGAEYIGYNDVYCCNIQYRKNGVIVTEGFVKSDNPYWNRDLNFMVWSDDSVAANKNLVGYYDVEVPSADRTIDASTYTFLRRIDVGDKIRPTQFNNYYDIASIQSPAGKTYEYLVLNKPWSERGVKTYILNDLDPKKELKNEDGVSISSYTSFDTFVENLPPDGYQIYVKRQDKEPFPMADDYGSLGASAYGENIEGLVRNTRRIKKPFLQALLRLLFPVSFAATTPHKNFKIWVKKDSEAAWEVLGQIDLKKLTFKEERNADDVLDALRHDFKEVFIVPSLPPVTVYDIDDDIEKGFQKYFYLSMERVYDADSPGGYYDGFVLRARNKEWWFKVANGEGMAIIDDYGFSASKEYKNFYDPDNIYKRLLLEKQAWETEVLILKDLYDHSDKIARAFDQGDLNRTNSKYQSYLAKPEGSTVSGISDILMTRIPAYEKQLLYLISSTGPVYQTLYPDFVHPEDSASPAIALTFKQTSQALSTYNGAYLKEQFYKTLNNNNNLTWRNDYVKWVLSLERGLIYQKDARSMSDATARTITVGLRELPALEVGLAENTVYTVENPSVSVKSDSSGKLVSFTVTLIRVSDTESRVEGLNIDFPLYKQVTSGGITSLVYKTLNEVCLDISNYTFGSTGPRFFTCKNIFEHYENSIVHNMLEASMLPIDPVSGTVLSVTTVSDARSSDARVLFLDKGIEDRVYTHNIRELPGFTLKYLGDYYSQSKDSEAFVVLSYNVFFQISYGIFLDNGYNKKLVIKGTTVDFNDLEFTFDLYDSVTSSYKTLGALVSEIKAYRYENVQIFDAQVMYADPTVSAETVVLNNDFVTAPISSTGSIRCTTYAHINTSLDDVDSEINQGIFRIYYAQDFKKKLEISFSSIIVDGTVIRTNPDQISETFVFDFQKSDLAYKTLLEFSDELSAFRYKHKALFEASPIYQKDEGSGLSTRYVVVDDTARFLGFDSVENIYVDTFVQSIAPTSSDRDVSNVQNAYFAHPFYTSNGNPKKLPIEGIPVSGAWDTQTNEPVMELQCIGGVDWEFTYNDFESGSYKSYTPTQIVNIIDTQGHITEEQYNTVRTVENQPVVSIIKEMVLTRKSTLGDTILTVNLRQYDTINKLVSAINALTVKDAQGVSTNVFFAKMLGSASIQGTYKSFELNAVYVPIIRSFYVTYENQDGTIRTEYKPNHLIGWSIESSKYTSAQKTTLVMSEKRYSTGTSYQYRLSAPDVAYQDTLINNPQGFRRDILAFDIYCWDDDGYYEIKNNWIYFRSAYVGYEYSSDLGQPDKTLGYGIPLASSGHISTSSTESLVTLINRINSNGIVSKKFYANLKFTRSDINEPGFFEYGYLPNYHTAVPKSVLDNVYLRDDNVLTLRPGTGYSFLGSSYNVNSTTHTIDLTSNWSYTYAYSVTFDFSTPAYSTVGGLVSSINSELVPNIVSSVFDANVVGTHSSDNSSTILSDKGPVVEVTEVFTVDTLLNYVIVSRSDWYVDDIVTFTTTGTLPAPLVAGTPYYVVGKSVVGPVINLQVSTSFGGPSINITSVGSGIQSIHREYIDLLVDPLSVVQPALQIRVRNLSGVNYAISNARYEVADNQSSLTLTCSIRYFDTFSLIGQDFSTLTIGELGTFIGSLQHYVAPIFPPIFNSQVVNDFYTLKEAIRMLSATGSIDQNTYLTASLHDIVAINLLNMSTQANTVGFTNYVQAISTSTYDAPIPIDRDLSKWVDEVLYGDYKKGFISLDILPLKIAGVSYGIPDVYPQTQLQSDNIPAHVFFGILGDISWVQISDQNLHTQLNYVKERLGMPWKNDLGIVVPDYYTPEQFNVDNPYAIDIDNFLGYLRTVRYNQIKNSVINEALVKNKYFWLYMKFHKEFGCDQRVIALKKQISQKEQDSGLLEDLS
jgi:hypothetical protein